MSIQRHAENSRPLSSRPSRLVVSRRTLEVFLASLAYSCFVVFFPWEEITRQGGWRDLENYVEYFEMQGLSKRELLSGSSFVAYLTQEVLWDEIVRWLIDRTGDAVTALRLISFFTCMVWGVFLFSRIPSGWALLFLLHPTSIDIAMSGVRNGFAWALIILALMTSSTVIRITLLLAAPFIHASSAALGALYIAAKVVVAKIRAKGLIILSLISLGAGLGLVLTLGNELILGALGDRRIGESYVRGGGSLEQMLFWAVLLGTQLSSGREYLRRNALVVAVLTWYLVMNPLIPWSYRVWGGFLPVIAVSIWDLPSRKRAFILYLWLGYLTLWYLYWTKLFEFWYPL